MLRATGTESESGLPFAGPHLLLGRAADQRPAAQRDGLGSGVADGSGEWLRRAGRRSERESRPAATPTGDRFGTLPRRSYRWYASPRRA
ncbi:hypothetical protein [Streptomyces sp. NPDC018059]|uniref:hypothetical protein n=1 Tax=Streptomyces sp. NPDC018059 TaxID=3365041 RepID=UPI0037B3128F